MIGLSTSIFLATLPLIIVYILNEKSKRDQFERENKYKQKWIAYSNLISSFRTAFKIRDSIDCINPMIQTKYLLKFLPQIPIYPQDPTKLDRKQLRHIEFLMCTAASVRVLDNPEIFDVNTNGLLDQVKLTKAIEELRNGVVQSIPKKIRMAKEQMDESIDSLRLLGISPDIFERIDILSKKIFPIADPKIDIDILTEELKAIETRLHIDLQNTIEGK